MRSSISTTAVSRRGFLRGAGLTAFAVLGAGSLAACSSAVGEQRAGDASAQPVRGGSLKVGVTDDINPPLLLTGGSLAGTLMLGLVFETLTRYPVDSIEPQPLLAKSWEQSADGLTYTVHLRDDVYFHSGRQFTAKDAEFSLRTYTDPKFSAQLRSTAATIIGYDTSDPQTLVLTLAHPVGNLFDVFELAPIFDSETFGQLQNGETFIGTGPFVFSSRSPNSQITFERNTNYRVPDRPYLDRVEALIIPDAQGRLSALKSGRIDYAGELAGRDAQTLRDTDGFNVTRLEGAETQSYIGVSVTAPALADVRVRKAVAYAIDRDRIVTEVLRGSGYAVNLPWPKHSVAYDEAKNTTYTRDVAKAKSLVAEVGELPTIPLTYPGGGGDFEAIAQIVQADLADVGIAVELDPVEQSVFLKTLIAAEFRGLWLYGHTFAQYVPSTLTVSAYPFNAAHNASRYSSPEYTQAAAAAWETRDGVDGTAVEHYAQISDLLLRDVFIVEIAVQIPQPTAATRVHDLAWTKSRQTLLTDAYVA